MTAGIPGVGIGGLFYLLSALLMPVDEAARAVRRSATPSRWSIVLRQSLLALWIVVSIAVAGVIIGWLVGFLEPALVSRIGGHQGPDSDPGVPIVLKAATVYFTFGTLAGVLVGVQLLRLLVRRR